MCIKQMILCVSSMYRKAWFSSLLTLICYSVQRACQGVSEAAAIMSESEWIQCIENDQGHWSACTFDTNVSNIFIIRHLLNKSWNHFISFCSRSTHSLYFSTCFSSFVPLMHKQLSKVCSISDHPMVLNTQHKYLYIQTFSELMSATVSFSLLCSFTHTHKHMRLLQSACTNMREAHKQERGRLN